MKNPFSLLLALLLLSPSFLLAAPKIATFDITKAMESHQGNKDDVAAFQAAREKLLKDPRKVALDEMTPKIQALQAKMQEVAPNSEEQANLTEIAKSAAENFNDLSNQWREFATETSKKLTTTLVNATNKRNSEIIAIAHKIAESQGFDWVIETSGDTNSRMPVVLYLRNHTDITDAVIKELEKAFPPAE